MEAHASIWRGEKQHAILLEAAQDFRLLGFKVVVLEN